MSLLIIICVDVPLSIKKDVLKRVVLSLNRVKFRVVATKSGVSILYQKLRFMRSY